MKKQDIVPIKVFSISIDKSGLVCGGCTPASCRAPRVSRAGARRSRCARPEKAGCAVFILPHIYAPSEKPRLLFTHSSKDATIRRGRGGASKLPPASQGSMPVSQKPQPPAAAHWSPQTARAAWFFIQPLFQFRIHDFMCHY